MRQTIQLLDEKVRELERSNQALRADNSSLLVRLRNGQDARTQLNHRVQALEKQLTELGTPVASRPNWQRK